MGWSRGLACPELIKAQIDSASLGVVLDTRTQDTWSLGCMFLELFTGFPPFFPCEPFDNFLEEVARQHDECVSVIMPLLCAADQGALQYAAGSCSCCLLQHAVQSQD